MEEIKKATENDENLSTISGSSISSLCPLSPSSPPAPPRSSITMISSVQSSTPRKHGFAAKFSCMASLFTHGKKKKKKPDSFPWPSSPPAPSWSSFFLRCFKSGAKTKRFHIPPPSPPTPTYFDDESFLITPLAPPPPPLLTVRHLLSVSEARHHSRSLCYFLCKRLLSPFQQSQLIY